jgi:hypothetical protein
VGLFSPPPSVFMAWCLIKQKGEFTYFAYLTHYIKKLVYCQINNSLYIGSSFKEFDSKLEIYITLDPV